MAAPAPASATVQGTECRGLPRSMAMVGSDRGWGSGVADQSASGEPPTVPSFRLRALPLQKYRPPPHCQPMLLGCWGPSAEGATCSLPALFLSAGSKGSWDSKCLRYKGTASNPGQVP